MLLVAAGRRLPVQAPQGREVSLLEGSLGALQRVEGLVHHLLGQVELLGQVSGRDRLVRGEARQVGVHLLLHCARRQGGEARGGFATAAPDRVERQALKAIAHRGLGVRVALALGEGAVLRGLGLAGTPVARRGDVAGLTTSYWGENRDVRSHKS